jgi:cytochrome c oxidase subunit 2
MYRYTYRPGQKADYVEGNHRLEIAWTLVPAAILLFIAFAQINAWERIKYISRMPEAQVVVQVTARQWDWSIRTPADAERFYVSDKTSDADKQIKHKEARHWAERTEMDDLVLPDELHTWKDANVKIYLRTQDVLHSFFLPNLRLKQDALPGKTIPMWFKATDHNCRYNADTGKTELTDPNKEWEIACAELCGGGHFRMRGKLYVHETKDEYLKWLTAAVKAQKTHKSDNPAGTPVAANTDR